MLPFTVFGKHVGFITKKPHKIYGTVPVVRGLELVGLLVGEELELGVPLAARALDG